MTLQEALDKFQAARTDAEIAYWQGYCDALSEQSKAAVQSDEGVEDGSVGR